MHLFVASASKLILNISLQPSTVSFLDLSRLVAAPEPGFSGDALRFSLLGIGALHDAWARGHADAAVLDTTLAVARGMTDAASACLAATVALGSGRIAGGVEETALAAAAMLSYSQVLAGANGKREPLELAYGLIKSGGGFENLLANARAKGEMRKVLEFIAVFDVLGESNLLLWEAGTDACAARRCSRDSARAPLFRHNAGSDLVVCFISLLRASRT